MCTVSWSAGIDPAASSSRPPSPPATRPAAPGYELFCNRDESRTRPVATAPTAQQRATTHYLAPTDTDSGGTWILVNEFALTLCLLNLYQVTSPRRGGLISRGLLVAELADCRGIDETGERLAARNLDAFRPFTLLALEPADGDISESDIPESDIPESDISESDIPETRVTVVQRIWQWNGHHLESVDVTMPLLTSSGFDAAGAEAARQALWQETAATGARMGGGTLLDLHRSHRPQKGPFSPCMHRPDAITVSLCHVRVDAQSVTMAYAEGSPCESQLGRPIALARRADVLA